MRGEAVRFDGGILYLTEDPGLLRRQLDGERLAYDSERALLDNISTDEITPGWVCFYYDDTLARYVNVGIRHDNVQKDDFRGLGPAVLVSGLSKGCGSSRETAPYAEKWAGVQLVIARTIEKIYGQNCQNIGLLTSTDFGLIPRIEAGEAIPIEEFTRGLDPISADIVRYGGLFSYNKARMSGDVAPPAIETARRPMNITEKIIAHHAVVDASTGRTGVPAVAPGDALFCRADVRFTHEYVTPMADSLFRKHLGDDAGVTDPGSVYTFRDHLTFVGDVLTDAQRRLGLGEKAASMAVVQEDFARRHGVRLFGEVPEGGSESICHISILDEIGLPGQLIVGSDSHTCMAGALGAFAFGVGSTDMANAWFTRDVRVVVPQVVRIELTGEMSNLISAKDVMLRILADPFIRSGKSIGKVLEFGGQGARSLSVDERATLTNMSVEAGAFTGIIEADEKTLLHIQDAGRFDPAMLKSGFFFRPDPDAEYAHRFEIDLSTLVPMVARPGDPRNGIPLQELEAENGPIAIDIAYGGSCTGGKRADMDLYARVLREAREMGLTVADGVRLFIQFGSQAVKEYARERGYIELFLEAGAELVNPSCGACIRAGPGVSTRPDQVTVSAINRNFPGRSGPGKVYLSSPLVVAASAVAGCLSDPSQMAAHHARRS